MVKTLLELIGLESLTFQLSTEVSKNIRDKFDRSIDSYSRIEIDKKLGIEVEKEIFRRSKNLIKMPDYNVYDAEIKDSDIQVEFKSTQNNSFTYSNNQRNLYKNDSNVLCIYMYSKYINGTYHITIIKNVWSNIVFEKFEQSKYDNNTTWYVGINTKMDNAYSLEKPKSEEELMLINELLEF